MFSFGRMEITKAYILEKLPSMLANADIKYWYLRDHQLFRNLGFAEIDALCVLKRFKKSKKDEVVELPFTEKDRIYFLKHGTLKLIRITDVGDE